MQRYLQAFAKSCPTTAQANRDFFDYLVTTTPAILVEFLDKIFQHEQPRLLQIM